MTRHQSFAPSTGAFIVVPEENEKSEPFSNRKQVRIFLVWWARVDYASRAAKNSLAGCFCPAGRKAPGRSCSHPPAYVSLTFVQKKTASVSLHQRFFMGAGGFEPPKLKSSRFTVCPHWPLGNTPIYSSSQSRTACIYYHSGAYLSTAFYSFFRKEADRTAQSRGRP